MNTVLTLLANPYIVLAILITVMMVACMIYVHVSDKKDMAFKKKHMYFDNVTAKWYYKNNNL